MKLICCPKVLIESKQRFPPLSSCFNTNFTPETSNLGVFSGPMPERARGREYWRDWARLSHNYGLNHGRGRTMGTCLPRGNELATSMRTSRRPSIVGREIYSLLVLASLCFSFVCCSLNLCLFTLSFLLCLGQRLVFDLICLPPTRSSVHVAASTVLFLYCAPEGKPEEKPWVVIEMHWNQPFICLGNTDDTPENAIIS